MATSHPDFDAFYTAAWPRLYRAVYGILGERQLTEDAVQSAFAKAYAAWPRVRDLADPTAYVRAIAVNEALGRFRRGFVRYERSVDPTSPDGLRATIASPEAAIVDRDAVWRAIRALPPRQRAIVVLRYYEGLSEAQIADTLGCRPGTVKSQASAALANLRRAMTHRFADPAVKGA